MHCLRRAGWVLVAAASATAAACGGTAQSCGGTAAEIAGHGGATPGSSLTAGKAGGARADCDGLMRLRSFDNSLEGFAFNKSATVAPYVNLAADGFANPPAATVEWSGLVDHNTDAVRPRKGSLKISATFSDWNQQLYLEVGGAANPLLDPYGNPLDVRNKILSVQARLDSGLTPDPHPSSFYFGPAGPEGCAFYVRTGANVEWSASKLGTLTWDSQILAPGTGWADIAVDTTGAEFLEVAGELSPTDSLTIGIVIGSGDGYYGDFGEPLPTTIFIDDLTLEPQP